MVFAHGGQFGFGFVIDEGDVVGGFAHGFAHQVGHQQRHVFADAFGAGMVEQVMAFGGKAHTERRIVEHAHAGQDVRVFSKLDDGRHTDLFLDFLLTAVFDFVIGHGGHRNKHVLVGNVLVHGAVHRFGADGFDAVRHAIGQSGLYLAIHQSDFGTCAAASARQGNAHLA